MSKVLILSHDQDSHTAVMVATLSEMGTDAFTLDLSSFPASSTLTYDYGGSGVTIEVGSGGSPRDLGAYGAAWWRRPQHVDTSLIADHADNLFAQGEWDEALSALWPMLDVFWINEPHVDRLASRKGWQLKVAKAMGLSIPRTLITTDPNRVHDFVKTCGGPERTVYKSFSATHAAWDPPASPGRASAARHGPGGTGDFPGIRDSWRRPACHRHRGRRLSSGDPLRRH